MSATIQVSPNLDVYPQIARQFVTEHQITLDSSQYISQQKVEEKNLEGVINISVPDFGFEISSPIVDISSQMQAGEVQLTVALDERVLVRFLLTGFLSKNDGLFRIENTGVGIADVGNQARSDFITSTFWAILGLAGKVRLRWPELQLELNLKFHSGLSAVSEMMERRLLAYRIMVIERATRTTFDLPSFVTPENVKSIALIYNAIMHRSFPWPIRFVDYGWPATQETLNRLLQIAKMPFIRLGPHPQSEHLFGEAIPLGEGFIIVQDQIIENFDSIVEEFSRNDGHIVRAMIRSLTGQGGYDLPNAPRLPSRPWDSTIQGLVDLDKKLDQKLTQRYNDLAAGSLANLSEKERKEITARPELDEDAFTFER